MSERAPDVKGTQDVNLERKELIDSIKLAGREHSSANVMMLNVIATRLGLNIIEVKTIDILQQMGPLTPGVIAEQTGLATPSVTALIDRLEKKGFVQRVRDSEDRRRVFVTLDQQHYAELFSLFGSFIQSIEHVLEPYSDEQLVLIQDFLKRSAQVMRAQTPTSAKL
jgi:DNA-binding MarR family transcriptional regulator